MSARNGAMTWMPIGRMRSLLYPGSSVSNETCPFKFTYKRKATTKIISLSFSTNTLCVQSKSFSKADTLSWNLNDLFILRWEKERKRERERVKSKGHKSWNSSQKGSIASYCARRDMWTNIQKENYQFWRERGRKRWVFECTEKKNFRFLAQLNGLHAHLNLAHRWGKYFWNL